MVLLTWSWNSWGVHPLQIFWTVSRSTCSWSTTLPHCLTTVYSRESLQLRPDLFPLSLCLVARLKSRSSKLAFRWAQDLCRHDPSCRLLHGFCLSCRVWPLTRRLLSHASLSWPD